MNETAFSIECVYFRSYAKKDSAKDPSALYFDPRCDFLVNDSFGGIMAKIILAENYSCYESAPRDSRITYTLIDNSDHRVCDAQTLRACMTDNEFLIHYLSFDQKAAQLMPGHSYTLVVHDDLADVTLGECEFHLFSELALGSPTQWYSTVDCGIHPAWDHTLHKTLSAIPYKDYYIAFYINQLFGENPPHILPELEIRLYISDDEIERCFTSPTCVDYDSNTYFVKMLFNPTPITPDNLYAELRCMGFRLCGFNLNINGNDVSSPQN